MVLELDRVTVSINNTPLFDPVTLRVEPGQVTTVMGPSGCGKSTLLAAIVGDLNPVFSLQGDVRLDDQSVLTLPMQRRRIGLLYQDDLLFPHMNVGQNLGFALASSLPRRERLARVEEYLALAGLEGYAERDVASLSGGQRARVSLLRTLMAEPRAVLLDEPFSKLDTAMRDQFRDWVFSTLQERAVPALQVTHDKEDCGDGPVYLIQEGRFA
ncbi:MAG: ATP-binding cassette domain-containing protein [Natronospirillum sp.]|uniref:ATP-binding cassette domain-containing protein n=1 Tax=Natronospirillum sp. TaxID=2812955 RepID=UPI0025FDD074|nr:ATP-binding cassette domain-containing protein [Natronospirillum sp.]MCH8552156.1 ATP-binding cassette domain-containing protein [Natronospirillum sp.]